MCVVSPFLSVESIPYQDVRQEHSFGIVKLNVSVILQRVISVLRKVKTFAIKTIIVSSGCIKAFNVVNDHTWWSNFSAVKPLNFIYDLTLILLL